MFSILSLDIILSNIILSKLMQFNPLQLDFEWTHGMQIRALSSFSLIKCLSTSICLVLSCCMGLSTILIVDLLSQYDLIGSSHFIFGSSYIIFNHRSSHIPWAIVLISALTLDLSIHFVYYSSKLPGFHQERCSI